MKIEEEKVKEGQKDSTQRQKQKQKKNIEKKHLTERRKIGKSFTPQTNETQLPKQIENKRIIRQKDRERAEKKGKRKRGDQGKYEKNINNCLCKIQLTSSKFRY